MRNKPNFEEQGARDSMAGEARGGHNGSLWPFGIARLEMERLGVAARARHSDRRGHPEVEQDKNSFITRQESRPVAHI